MKEIKAPNLTQKGSEISIFLAGSIEMGLAENWQTKLVEEFKNDDIIFFNPRRDDWDSSWVQSINNPNFYEQVNWELNHLSESNIRYLYLDPNTKSPISLLELGLYANCGYMVVCCPDGFWRKGNVEIVCERYNIPLCNTFEQSVEVLKEYIKFYKENLILENTINDR